MKIVGKAFSTLIFGLLFLGSAAHAQFFLGTTTSTALVAGVSVPFVGLHGGTYDLSGNYGARGGFELLPAVINGLTIFQANVDGVYSTGEAIVFYGGPTLGYVNVGGLSNAFVGATVGVDFDAASVISYYIEAQPRYYFGGQPVFYLRSGLNFHIGL